jgi:hypothetical protein
MHRVSAAALIAAREVLKRYQLQPRPGDFPGKVNGLTGSEAHIAIIIDHATNVFKVALLRPEVFYWQRALRSRVVEPSQIVAFLKKCVDTFAEVPQYGPKDQPPVAYWEYPVDFGPSAPHEIPLTKSAVEAARFLNYYYEVMPIGPALAPEAERIALAQTVEVGLGMDHAIVAAPLAQFYLERVKEGQATEKEIRACFRKLGIILAYLPTFSDRREETMLLT